MNPSTIKGDWNEIKGKIKQKWAKLTDDDVKGLEGNFDQLTGKLQKTYGYSKEKALSEFEDFKRTLGSNVGSSDRSQGGADRYQSGSTGRPQSGTSDRAQDDEKRH